MRLRAVFSSTLCFALTSAMMTPLHASEEFDLVRYMGTMQYMAHKAGLAIDARNQPLANFYIHEIEAIIEKLETIDSFDGYPIGSLVKSVLVPSFTTLEDAVKARDWGSANIRFDRLLASCNSCHQSTEHGYIRIQKSRDNPFMQAFETR